MDVTTSLSPIRLPNIARVKKASIHHQQGLTLFELITALAIFAITLSIGVPAIQGILHYNRVATHINLLSRSISLGRSEAIKRNRHVVMCKSQDMLSCTRRGSWQQGWMIFVDLNVDRQRSEDEPLLLARGKLPGNLYVKFSAFRSPNFITFRPTGITLMNGTFSFCIYGQPDTRKALILSKTGRVYISKTGYNGKTLKCPEK